MWAARGTRKNRSARNRYGYSEETTAARDRCRGASGLGLRECVRQKAKLDQTLCGHTRSLATSVLSPYP